MFKNIEEIEKKVLYYEKAGDVLPGKPILILKTVKYHCDKELFKKYESRIINFINRNKDE